ncbi:MAG: hypothetical protein KAT65_28965 [Methanophagales archaeon]|nr:hypothetical protein [Methanophagales archaeon]
MSSHLPEQEKNEIFLRCQELHDSVQKAKAEAESRFNGVKGWLEKAPAIGYKDKKEAYHLMSARINRFGNIMEARQLIREVKHAFNDSIRNLQQLQSEHGVNCTNETRLIQGWLEETTNLLELANEVAQGYDMIVKSSQEKHNYDINTGLIRLNGILIALTIIIVILTIAIVISSWPSIVIVISSWLGLLNPE